MPKFAAIPMALIIVTVYLVYGHPYQASGMAVLFGYGAVMISLVVVLWRGDDFISDALRDFLYALAIPFLLAGVFSVLSHFIPSLSRSYDQAGSFVAAQAVLIVALRKQWLPQEKLINRAMVWVAYAVVSGGVLLIPLALVSWLLDIKPPLWVLSGLVAVALLSAAIFPWLGQRLTMVLENLLFPDASRMRHQVESLRRDLEDVRSRLRRAERMRLVGEIAAQVAHEIKNPLGPIKGYAKLLLEDARSDSSVTASTEKGLGIIVEEADRIDERISRLLGFARDATGEHTRSDLNTVCRRAVILLNASDELKQAGSIEMNLCTENADMIADGPAIEEALYNLLLNAAQVTGGTGRIRLNSRWEQTGTKRFFVIEVYDDGPGFSCDDPEQLFQPFYTTRPGGTGLGLGIVRNIVKGHGGSVSAAHGEDNGAVFIIRLPESNG